MIIDIGIAAGDIWHCLDKHGRISFSDIIKDVGKPRELLLMSLGWLAREGHVKLEQIDSEYYVKLSKTLQK